MTTKQTTTSPSSTCKITTPLADKRPPPPFIGRAPPPFAPMAETRKQRKANRRSHHNQNNPQRKAEKSPSWGNLKVVLSCKHHHTEEERKICGRIGCSVSLCKLKESSKVMNKPENSSFEIYRKLVSVGGCKGASRSVKAPLNEINGPVTSSYSSSHSSAPLIPTSSSSATTTTTITTTTASSLGGSFRGMHLRRLSGCYECHTVVDQTNGAPREPSLRSNICTCPDCGEIFVKSESLELHQAVRHAVSELGPEDTSRNIVEIIFQSSWLKKQAPACKIDRILKVNNTQKTISKFEEYRDYIKSKANRLAKKYPRCIADGNELLRFHCTTFTCSIGSDGSTSLCHSIPQCKLCSIIRDGFKFDGSGKIPTMATSGRAHDTAEISSDFEKRAMLVCRVIAGRVKKSQDVTEEYDSVCGPAGVYSNLDKLFVFNPKAILPCFLVIYL